MLEFIKKHTTIVVVITLLILNFGYQTVINRTDECLEKDNSLVNEAIISESAIKSDDESNIYEQADTNNINMDMEHVSSITNSNNEKNDVIDTQNSAIMDNGSMPVYICGEVVNPGVYYVTNGAIINDVLGKCGGFTSDANTCVVNLAQIVNPNEKIIVPKLGEEIDKNLNSYENIKRCDNQPAESVEDTHNSSALININTASKDELMKLNGIGSSKAEAIINYREENGGYKDINEIVNVSGIGDKTFEKIMQDITI